MHTYTLIKKIVSAEDYMYIREKTLGAKEKKWAEKVAFSWYGVHIVYEGKTVGMGRIIGDGGLTFQITDIAILPEHQQKGLGKKIMHALMSFYHEHAPQDAYLSLMADGNAKFLYKQFGFQELPNTVGMKYISNV